MKNLFFFLILFSQVCTAQLSTTVLKNDSTIDQTVVLQTLINTNKSLTLPAGTYLTNRLNLHSDFALFGNGRALLKLVKTDDLYNKLLNVVGIKNVTVQGIELDLSNAKGSMWDGTPAIEIRNSSNIRILNCYIHDNKYLGIRLGGGNDSIVCSNNTIEDTDTGIHANNRNTNLTFTNNIIRNGTSEGITVYGYDIASKPSAIRIEKNVITGKKTSWGISIPFAEKVLIKDNIIVDCRAGIGLKDVVSVHSNVLFTSEKDCQFINNKMYDCKLTITKTDSRIYTARELLSF